MRSWLQTVFLLYLALPAAASDLFTVAGVRVDKTATDGVTAKIQAVAEGEQSAAGKLLKRLTPYGAWPRLPEVEVDMLDGFSFHHEQNSATRYVATIDFSFNANAVRSFLRKHDIEIIELQARPTAVIPLVYANDKFGIENAWTDAWQKNDIKHSLTPLAIRKFTDYGVLEAADIKELMEGGITGGMMEILQQQNFGPQVLLAVAVIGSDTPHVVMSGYDGVGRVHIKHDISLTGKNITGQMEEAAGFLLTILEHRWKIEHAGTGFVTTDAMPQDLPGDHLTNVRPQAATIYVTVLFDSFKQWRDMRITLEKIPRIGQLEVNSLASRSADISIKRTGSADTLAGLVRRYGFILQQGRDGLVLYASSMIDQSSTGN
jgi:hypothetical protein